MIAPVGKKALMVALDKATGREIWTTPNPDGFLPLPRLEVRGQASGPPPGSGPDRRASGDRAAARGPGPAGRTGLARAEHRLLGAQGDPLHGGWLVGPSRGRRLGLVHVPSTRSTSSIHQRARSWPCSKGLVDALRV